MMKIKKIEDPNLKTEITLNVMHALPKWFNPPEDIDNKAIIHRDFPFFSAFNQDKAIWFVALKRHNDYTIEVYNIGVLEDVHRNGIGHLLIERCVKYCEELNLTYLTVKTLDESASYEPYNQTRSFYYKEGFIPLEVFKTVWDEDNPCLFLVKKI